MISVVYFQILKEVLFCKTYQILDLQKMKIKSN